MSTEPDIDWKYWQKLPELKVFEAIALLHGREPGDSPPEEGEADSSYRKTLRLLTASLSNRKFFSPGTLNLADSAMHGVRLLEVGKWAVENGYVLPAGFPVQPKLSIHPSNISRAPAPISPLKGGSTYSRPAITSKAPDWDFWRAMRKVDDRQACALSLNIEPDSSLAFPTEKLKEEFDKRIRLLRSNINDHKIFTPQMTKHSGLGLGELYLSEFAAWGLSLGWDDMPQELKTIAPSPAVAPGEVLPATATITTTHKIKNRTQPLDAEIAMAKKTALDSNDPNSVWAELIKMAEKQIGCLLGPDENSIRYQSGDDVKFFKKRSLNERMNRAATR